MDATRIRVLIEAAASAQTAFDNAEDNLRAAKELRDKLREKQVKEVGNLKAALDTTFVMYGDKIVRVGNDEHGIRLFFYPLVTVPVLAPPPAPLPEAEPPPVPVPAPAKAKAAPPLAAGTVPTLGNKK